MRPNQLNSKINEAVETRNEINGKTERNLAVTEVPKIHNQIIEDEKVKDKS
jgi:hypothetical protein